CFVLLFVFIAKYREALDQEQPFESVEETVTPSTEFRPREEVLEEAKENSLELVDLEEKVRSLHYQLLELRTAVQKNNAEFTKQMARMEQRVSTFEQEYVNKLQPTLLRVIDELEHIKGVEDSGKI
ncbi:MAG: hypothetical protein J5601_05665, partial [Elusimicrobiaceae bacterium]|nr:hypothetical protein [Elusimicrobiaceae bacterium]